MYVRCRGEAEAREGAPSGTRDKAGGQAAEPGLPGRGRARAVLPGRQSRTRPLRFGRSASCFLAVPGSRA